MFCKDPVVGLFHYYAVITALCISFQGLDHFNEIFQEAHGIIISRGDLGIDLPPENVCFNCLWNNSLRYLLHVIRYFNINVNQLFLAMVILKQNSNNN